MIGPLGARRKDIEGETGQKEGARGEGGGLEKFAAGEAHRMFVISIKLKMYYIKGISSFPYGFLLYFAS